jgi:NhaA family Na+:H+ antiporter
MLEPVTLGIVLGLFIGKPLGIVGASWLAIRSGLAPKPEGVNWGQLTGVGMLGGIGFTMSLFIGTLAFADATLAVELRLGVLGGSLLSAMLGLAVLAISSRPSLTRSA